VERGKEGKGEESKTKGGGEGRERGMVGESERRERRMIEKPGLTGVHCDTEATKAPAFSAHTDPTLSETS
jgi:hypothetical protein